MNSKKIAGDPTPQSPVAVEKNKDYQIMTDYVGNSYYPSAAECIALHVSTGTYWRTVYRLYEDSSEANFSATWREVVPEKVTITKYKSK